MLYESCIISIYIASRRTISSFYTVATKIRWKYTSDSAKLPMDIQLNYTIWVNWHLTLLVISQVSGSTIIFETDFSATLLIFAFCPFHKNVISTSKLNWSMRDHKMEEGPMPTHWYYYDDVTLITGLAHDLQWLPRTRYKPKYQTLCRPPKRP